MKACVLRNSFFSVLVNFEGKCMVNKMPLDDKLDKDELELELDEDEEEEEAEEDRLFEVLGMPLLRVCFISFKLP
jgi:hypothetical protein